MWDNKTNSTPIIIKEDDELNKLEMIKNALWLPATTQDDILEIAKKILDWEQQWEKQIDEEK